MRQHSLLDCLSQDSRSFPALAGVIPSIRAGMARVAKAYPEGRKALPDAVSEVAQRENVPLTPKGGKTVTLDQIHKWLQPSDSEHEPGIRAMLCFCIATQDFSPLEPIWQACDLTVIPKKDLRFLEYGKKCDALDKAREEYKKAKGKM